MTLNISTDISTYIQNIFDDAMLVARENNIMTTLVTTFNDRQTEEPRKTSEYGSLTMNAVGEMDDLVSQQFKPSVLSTLTPAEVAAQVFISDRRIATDPFGAREDASTELGMSMAAKMETDLLSNFSSLTGGTIGAAGSAVSWGYFYAMLTVLRNQYAPLPYTFVCTPNQWHILAKAASVAGASVINGPALQDQVNSQWFVGRVGPVNIYTTSSCTASGTDAYAAMFTRASLALDVRRAPRLEPERDASRRGFELNISTVYAHGVWRPKYGVQGLFANATPSS